MVPLATFDVGEVMSVIESEQITTLLPSWSLAPVVRALQAMRGVGQIVAGVRPQIQILKPDIGERTPLAQMALPDRPERQRLIAAGGKHVEILDVDQIGATLIHLHVHKHAAGRQYIPHPGLRHSSSNPSPHQVFRKLLESRRDQVETKQTKLAQQSGQDRAGPLRDQPSKTERVTGVQIE